jgi:hypothetical protein
MLGWPRETRFVSENPVIVEWVGWGVAARRATRSKWSSGGVGLRLRHPASRVGRRAPGFFSPSGSNDPEAVQNAARSSKKAAISIVGRGGRARMDRSPGDDPESGIVFMPPPQKWNYELTLRLPGDQRQPT